MGVKPRQDLIIYFRFAWVQMILKYLPGTAKDQILDWVPHNLFVPPFSSFLPKFLLIFKPYFHWILVTLLYHIIATNWGGWGLASASSETCEAEATICFQTAAHTTTAHCCLHKHLQLISMALIDREESNAILHTQRAWPITLPWTSGYRWLWHYLESKKGGMLWTIAFYSNITLQHIW